MKTLVFIVATLFAAPAYAANVEACMALSNLVESIANARDAGMSMQAAQEMVRQRMTNAQLSTSMQETVRLIYTSGANVSPGQLAMFMFNTCMEN
jgi:uncharacterized protein YfiM (DUF2279 family)